MLQHQTPFALSFLALFFTFFCHCSATNFTVGDSAGWILPPYPSYYSNWSHSHFISVGDSLVFNFNAIYNLIQVTKPEYEHCTSLEPVKVFHSSPVIIPLNKKGVYFFTCSISTFCSLGQRIIISVHEKSPQNPPSPSPSPSPSPVPAMSPKLSPSASAPQSPASTPSTLPNGTNGGNPPVPDSTHSGKTNAAAMVCGTSFKKGLTSLIVTILGFWVM